MFDVNKKIETLKELKQEIKDINRQIEEKVEIEIHNEISIFANILCDQLGFNYTDNDSPFDSNFCFKIRDMVVDSVMEYCDKKQGGNK